MHVVLAYRERFLALRLTDREMAMNVENGAKPAAQR